MREKLPQLLQLALETVSLRSILFNRIVLTALIIVSATIGASAYIEANNDGRISGTVVTSDGEPVAGAEVTLRKIEPLKSPTTERTTTNEQGEFEFSNQTTLEYVIQVETDQGSASERYHVLFKGQSFHVDLVLESTDENQ